jgi:hypothetical protein
MAWDLNQSCEQHADRADCPDALIDRVQGKYGIIVHDGGGSVIEIAFCPWCGAKLSPVGDHDPQEPPSGDR